MALVEKEDDLKLIVDKDVWQEIGVDGKYLSSLTHSTIKSDLKITKKGER